ncbi:MAG: DUF2341 domain-containing protein, partial [Deltaproteobacteria bacterium]|nr:DUF2341 domain-containing protein [Deltaproteobacteria bacterium]
MAVKLDASSSEVFSYAQSDGDDILFTASDGTTKLDHEIEKYVDSMGNEELVAHVKIPFMSPGKYIEEDHSPPPAWYGASWQYSQKLTIDHTKIDAELSDFPLVVKLDPSSSNVFGRAQSDADDILFTASDGTTKLDHEIEKYVDTAGNEELVAHVKIPTVSASEDTAFHMYYGNSGAANQENPSGVWDTNYKGVWHLSEDPSGSAPQMTDSTANGNHGATGGSMTSDDQVSGKVDGALDFDGSNDYVEMQDSASLDIQDVITIEAWVKIDNYPTEWNLVAIKGDTSTGRAYGMWVRNTGDILLSYYNGASYGFYPGGQGFTTGRWHHLVGVIDTANNLRYIYIDGVIRASSSSAIPSMVPNDFPLYVGSRTSTWPTKGVIDEVRISDSARSAAWIKASYYSENNTLLTSRTSQPTTFYMYYGNSGASNQENANGVWDSGYVAVWHLSEDPSGTSPQIMDSTANTNHGSTGGFMTADDQIAGKVDGSLDFNANGQYVEVPDDASLDFGANDFTVAGWVRKDSPTVSWSTRSFVNKWNTGGSPGTNEWSVSLCDGADSDKPSFAIESGTAIYKAASPDPISLGEWHYLVAVKDGAYLRIYVDGFLRDLADIGSVSVNNVTDTNVYIATHQGKSSNSFLDGSIDEVRISSAVRSPEWIKTSYDSQNNVLLTSSNTGGGPKGDDNMSPTGNGEDSSVYQSDAVIDTAYWNNTTGNGLWSDPNNWSTGRIPGIGDSVIFDGAYSSTNCILDAVEDNLDSIILEDDYNGQVTLNGDFVNAAGELTLTGPDGLQVLSGTLICGGDTSAVNEASGGTEANRHGTGITINAQNITVGENGHINANGQGFLSNQGPGAGVAYSDQGSGGSHGGRGGDGLGAAYRATYGLFDQPTALGSGGGHRYAYGGSGGGAIKLNATGGTITIDGAISANGNAYFGERGAGGAGGSVWLIADTLEGAGVITADGGNGHGGEGGGGGGGR